MDSAECWVAAVNEDVTIPDLHMFADKTPFRHRSGKTGNTYDFWVNRLHDRVAFT